jgi:plastocyanin
MSTSNELAETLQGSVATHREFESEKKRALLPSSNTFIPVVGLLYFSVFAFALILQSIVAAGALAPYQFFFIPFAVISIIAAIGIWRRPRLGYTVAIPLTAILIIIFFATRDGNDVITVLSNPANANEFIFYVTNMPTFFLVLISSILGVCKVWNLSKSNPMQVMQPRTFSYSEMIALVILGFVLGGLVVGLLAGTESRLLSASAPQNTVTIVLGAGSISNSQFYVPSTLTVKVGTSVTWINHDSTAHTVTSTTGAFGSGNMNSGAVYTFTFNASGNYTYYCKYHPWMKGEIIVTSP